MRRLYGAVTMVDRPTLDAYDAHAAQYAQDWLDQAREG